MSKKSSRKQRQLAQARTDRRGTPTFLINGQQVFPSYAAMSATINEILQN